MKTILAIVGLIVVALIGTCAYKLMGGSKRAGAAAEQFHERYNNGKDGEIYEVSAPALKTITKKEDFLRLLAELRQQVGKFQSKSEDGVSMNTNNGVSMLEVKYTSTFEKGKVKEVITFDNSGDALLLLGYHYKIEGAAAPAPGAPQPVAPEPAPR